MVDNLLYIVIAVNGLILVLLGVMLIRKNNENNLSALQSSLNFLEKNQERLERMIKEDLAVTRQENSTSAAALRGELMKSTQAYSNTVLARMTELATLQKNLLDAFAQQLQALTQSNEQRLDKLRETVEERLQQLQADNNNKLEQMRATVDEKLQATLEQRLGESFKLVSDRLEQVQRGLGEMQTLAAGVGDLKRVLSNVKTRGIWGEIQLGNLLEQIMTPEQYAQNVATKAGSSERVEFAIKLPGHDDQGTSVWLPIDAKFPQEDYQRLLDAQDQANAVLAEEAGKALELRIKSEAKDIHNKYIAPPETTDFALMFLPVEGLYAEVLRRPGLCEGLMRDYRVVVTGPTTLAALLNSLQMGFRTLAIEQRSSEVWALLGAVKTEFGKFGDILDKTRKKLIEASNTIETASRKSRTIERKLKGVEQLPTAVAADMLSLDEIAAEIND